MIMNMGVGIIFKLILSAVPEKIGLDRQTDRNNKVILSGPRFVFREI